MSDATTPAAAAPAPQKAAKKVKKAKKVQHPPYLDMVKEAIVKGGQRRGMSRQAIVKHIGATYSVSIQDNVIKKQIKLAIVRGVTSNTLKQLKGTGASGSFKVASGKEEPKVKKPAAKKAPKAKKPRAATKKTPKKPIKKVVKKTKKVTKAKSPKKVVKKVAKKPAKPAKKKVVKKAAAKKK